MRKKASITLPGLLLLAIPATCLAGGHAVSHRAGRYAHASLHHLTRHSTHNSFHDTAAMPSERATEIQTALIQHGYLTGEPTGSWDAASIAAMQKLQADNGWQSKITPDSRALIKLGLGPKTQASSDVPPSPQQ
jgi:hypothetical protein